jgi:hypothetical protein
MTATGSASATPKTQAVPKKRPTAAAIAARDARIAELERELGMPSTLPAAAVQAASPVALIDLDDGTEAEELQRAPLFRAGGVTYSMVINPPPQWGFEAIALAGGADGMGPESGMAASQVFILRMMLGVDGLRALRDRDAINPQKLTQILAACSRTVYGAMEPPKTS